MLLFYTLYTGFLQILEVIFKLFYIYINIYFNSRLAPAGSLPLKLGVTELFSTKTLFSWLYGLKVLTNIFVSLFCFVWIFFFCIFPCFVFFILLTVFPMSLLSLFLSFSFVMHSALWLHVCEKHFIFASWWSVQNHMSVIFTFSAALILLNLCVGACCASPDPTVTEKCQDKLVRVVCNAVWRFLREVFFTFMRLLLK